MRKKYRELKRKGNVIVFPNTINRLLTDGMNALKEENFIEARDKLEEVLHYEPGSSAALGGYAYALYELGAFEEALDATEELLKVGPVRYLETMELYISILMQLRRYGEAETTIEALIEEGVLPDERIAQFRQLKELNERIHMNTAAETVDTSPYELQKFLALPPAEQERLVMELPAASYRAVAREMIEIAEHPDTDMLAKTYILFMLQKANVEASVSVRKFHYVGSFNIQGLPDPLTSHKLTSIKSILEDKLAKDPTRLEMANDLFDRHIYLLYPFQWEEFSAAEVADAYLHYLETMFRGESAIAVQESLLMLLLRTETWFELRNH